MRQYRGLCWDCNSCRTRRREPQNKTWNKCVKPEIRSQWQRNQQFTTCLPFTVIFSNLSKDLKKACQAQSSHVLIQRQQVQIPCKSHDMFWTMESQTTQDWPSAELNRSGYSGIKEKMSKWEKQGGVTALKHLTGGTNLGLCPQKCSFTPNRGTWHFLTPEDGRARPQGQLFNQHSTASNHVPKLRSLSNLSSKEPSLQRG